MKKMVCSLLSCAATTISVPSLADSSIQYDLSLARSSLRSVLAQISHQTGLQTGFYPDNPTEEGIIVGPLSGRYTVEVALQELLAASGLSFALNNERTITVMPNRSATRLRSDSSAADAGFYVPAEAQFVKLVDRRFDDQPGGGERLTEAQATDQQLAQVTDDAGRTGRHSQIRSTTGLEEVVVTAQKRSERLQDVPLPVTALSADALVQSSALRLSGYFDKIPGFSLSPGPRGEPFLSIRGINTNGAGNPNVGVVIDDVPFGANRSSGGGSLTPDLDPSQLARIEVLRGPQGTLYGASSMGGLLKYVTIDPSTTEFTARIQSDINSVKNGDEVGYGIRGNANVPLGQSMAVSASGFTRRDPGYIDDPVLGIGGINSATARGGRVAAIWRPSDAFSLKVAALLQDYDRDGSPEVHLKPGLGDLQQHAVRGAGMYDNKINFYSAVIDADLGAAKLTAVSGYNVVKNDSTLDFVSLAASSLTRFNVSGALFFDQNKTEKFSQEVRLDVPLSDRIDWLIGGFYSDEKSRWFQHIDAIDPITGAVAGRWYDVDLRDTFTEYAAFTDLTFHLTDRLDVQLGGRQSHNKQTYSLAEFGPLVGGQNVTPESDSNDDSLTYLLTARYTILPDLMVYGRFASGYRPGGPNRDFPGDVVPVAYKPDTTESYEIGAKGNVFDGSLTFDASVFYIDWSDIQYNARLSGFGYIANGSSAKSQGVELALTQRPWEGMTIAGWVSYNDAVLTDRFPVGSSTFGVSGNRLPYASKWSGNLSLDQEFPLAGTTSAFLGASVTYVGDRLGIFGGNAVRQEFPSYTTVDLRTGLKRDSWSLNVFANNIADKRGVLSGGIGYLNPVAFNYIQPRTLGLLLSHEF